MAIFLYNSRFLIGQIKRNEVTVFKGVHCAVLIVCTFCSINSNCISHEKLLSYGMWHHVVSYKCTDVSEEPAVSIISTDEFVPNYMASYPQRRQSSYPQPPHHISSITTADANTSAASSRLNWRPRRFKWTHPFRRKTKAGFCACAITFQTQSTLTLNLPTTTIVAQPFNIIKRQLKFNPVA